jgi:hypothetical protein
MRKKNAERETQGGVAKSACSNETVAVHRKLPG